MRIETLTRMSGQIADNCSGLTDEQAVNRITDHLRAFWTPAMITELAEYDGEHAGELDPRVSTALSQLVV
ncbi:MAG: NADH-dependent formate dehydrogenase delta subunit FdsD [Actinomycetota bacterium]